MWIVGPSADPSVPVIAPPPDIPPPPPPPPPDEPPVPVPPPLPPNPVVEQFGIGPAGPPVPPPAASSVPIRFAIDCRAVPRLASQIDDANPLAPNAPTA